MAVQLNITRLLAEAQQQYQQQQFDNALRLYYQAWIKLGKPQNEHPQAGEILTAIGSCYFKLQRYEPAIEALRSALDIPQMGNYPTTLLRLGQCLLHTGKEVAARTYLQRAYRIGGSDLFKWEDDRYITAITDLVA